MDRTVLCVVGTRPEVVKMAPVFRRLRSSSPELNTRLVTSGQHQGLLDRALKDFGLSADRALRLMEPGQNLTQMTARALVMLGEAIEKEKPQLVLSVGDTTTVLATAMACHFQKIPFGHVEAGLRTGNRYLPFPEEKNRDLVSRLSTLHFAPTVEARNNLLREGIAADSIHLTGNPVIDALKLARQQCASLPVEPPARQFLLVTAHRRENWGLPMRQIALGLRDLVERNPSLGVVFPAHPNPEVRGPISEILGKTERVKVIDPVGYPEFVALMAACRMVITDSGGVQEEAPAMGKRVLILRAETERPEGLDCGLGKLVGPDRHQIVVEAEALLRSPVDEPRASLPFGDGWAAERIARVVLDFCGVSPGEPPAEMPAWPLP